VSFVCILEPELEVTVFNEIGSVNLFCRDKPCRYHAQITGSRICQTALNDAELNGISVFRYIHANLIAYLIQTASKIKRHLKILLLSQSAAN